MVYRSHVSLWPCMNTTSCTVTDYPSTVSGGTSLRSVAEMSVTGASCIEWLTAGQA